MKNLAFHSLLRWKMIILPILTTSLVPLSWKGWENELFQLVKYTRKCFMQRASATFQIDALRVAKWWGDVNSPLQPLPPQSSLSACSHCTLRQTSLNSFSSFSFSSGEADAWRSEYGSKMCWNKSDDIAYVIGSRPLISLFTALYFFVRVEGRAQRIARDLDASARKPKRRGATLLPSPHCVLALSGVPDLRVEKRREEAVNSLLSI